MISLRSRLSWGLMLSLTLLLVLQWVVVTYAIERLTEDQLVSRLQHESEGLLAGVRFDGQGAMQLDAQRMGAVYQRPFSGHYYVVSSGDQRHLSRSLWDADLAVMSLPPGRQALLHLAGPEAQPLFAVAHGYRKQQRAITIVVAEDLSRLQAGMQQFQMLYAAVSAVGLMLLMLVQRGIVLRALRPLQAVRESMARLGRGEADQVEARGPEEIMPLIEELNRLLAGMERKTKRSRGALGNLAHSLKTRLTLLNQTAERAEIAAYPEVRAAIYAATEAIGQSVERELKRARLLGDIHPGRRVDLQAEIAQLVHTLRLLYAAREVDIVWDIATDARFVGDREDLLELLGNLLDNACKWCQGKVALTVAGYQDGVGFIVEDDGPGCSPEELDAIVRRGYRADESRPGSGLGLAIVQDIVEGYGGHLQFARSATLGGLRVEVRFAQANPP